MDIIFANMKSFEYNDYDSYQSKTENNSSPLLNDNVNKMYFNIKNDNYDILIMWFLLVATIILLLSLVISDADDKFETERSL